MLADLLALLLHGDRLSSEEVNAVGGPDKYTPLMSAVDMGAERAVEILLADARTDRSVKDKRGRTARELAEGMGEEGAHLLHLLK